MTEIIEKIRRPEKNEFFFTSHTNIGISEEFERLIKFINENSNIEIIRNDVETVEQLQHGRNFRGSPFNFKVIKNSKYHYPNDK